MEIFNTIVRFFAEKVPEWVALFACPALLVLIALVMFLFGGKRAYWGLSVIVLGAGFFLVACKEGSETALIYLALCAVLCGALRLLLLLPAQSAEIRSATIRMTRFIRNFANRSNFLPNSPQFRRTVSKFPPLPQRSAECNSTTFRACSGS